LKLFNSGEESLKLTKDAKDGPCFGLLRHLKGKVGTFFPGSRSYLDPGSRVSRVFYNKERMEDFVFRNPTKIIFGKKAMEQIRSNVRIFGKKVLLTYGGGSIKKNGIYDKVVAQLIGFEVKEFGGIEPNPRVETVRQALNQVRGFDPDIILAVGGGSVIDASKLLASSYYYDGDPWDFLVKDVEPKKYVPVTTVLTLSATGSEMNNGVVITRWETKEKLFFSKEELFPKFSILDPQNTFTVPKDQTAYGIVDAFSHVLEQYLHNKESVPLQDRLSESILLTLIENAPRVLKNPTDYDARANIMLSATMALNGLIEMGAAEDWATHMIEHEFSAFYDLPHGAGLAIITPRWMEVVKDQKKKKLIQYGRRVWDLQGSDNEVLEGAIQRTYRFFKSLGIKMSVAEWGIDAKHFETMISRLVGKGIGEEPLNQEQIEQILNSCLAASEE
jgi:alcohol dehydrogenase YqhD (iron-dependent ADH family)